MASESPASKRAKGHQNRGDRDDDGGAPWQRLEELMKSVAQDVSDIRMEVKKNDERISIPEAKFERTKETFKAEAKSALEEVMLQRQA